MLLEACKRLLAQYPGKVSTTFPVYGVDEGFLGARASRPRSQGPITPPSRGSRRSRAGRRRLMRWGGQPIPATLPPVVPLIVTHRAPRPPPPARLRASPWSRRLPLQGGVAEAEPQAKADAVGGPTNSRHLAHQHIYTSPAVAPLEGESQKPSRKAKTDAVGGPTNSRHLAHQHIYTSPAVAPLVGESQKPSRMAKADAVGGPTNTRHLAHQHIYTSPAVAPLEGESQKPSRQAKADAVGGVWRATSQ